MNCHPTLCEMTGTAEDGQLSSSIGIETTGDNHGFLCMRGKAGHEIVGNDHRLLKPQMRSERWSDQLSKTSWDAALEKIADKMQSVGREAVGFW